MLDPNNCPHCREALATTRKCYEEKRSPPDTVKRALLLGMIVGQRHDRSILDQCCVDCQTQLAEHEQRFLPPSPEVEAQMRAQFEQAQMGNAPPDLEPSALPATDSTPST